MSDPQELEIVAPDDWHVHLRDGAVLDAVVPHTAASFARAIVMPNLQPPVRLAAEAVAYRERVLAAVPPGCDFEPLMTCYLTDDATPASLREGFESGAFTAVKLYPAGATTNSHNGVTDLFALARVLETLQDLGMPLLLHGEVTDPAVDVFDREAVFIERLLDPLRRDFPALKLVLEHITTEQAVDYVRAAGDGLAATVTVHHLVINRNAMFAGGLRPHYYCLPVAKRERHRLALRAAATSGEARFFLGTDSAPHVDAAKESACGCAGIFTAANALSCLAHVFEEEGALARLEGFTSLHGADFYGLARNRARRRLVRQAQPLTPVSHVQTAEGPVRVFDPGFDLHWRVEECEKMPPP